MIWGSAEHGLRNTALVGGSLESLKATFVQQRPNQFVRFLFAIAYQL